MNKLFPVMNNLAIIDSLTLISSMDNFDSLISSASLYAIFVKQIILFVEMIFAFVLFCFCFLFQFQFENNICLTVKCVTCDITVSRSVIKKNCFMCVCVCDNGLKHNQHKNRQFSIRSTLEMTLVVVCV